MKKPLSLTLRRVRTSLRTDVNTGGIVTTSFPESGTQQGEGYSLGDDKPMGNANAEA